MKDPTVLNIAARLDRQGDARPHQRAVVFPEHRDRNGRIAWTHLSFEDAVHLSEEFARGLVLQGVQPGDRVSLLIRPSLDFIPLVFAVFKVGAVPVLVDPGMGRKAFLSCIERTGPRVLVASPLAQVLRMAFPAAFRSVEVSITAGSHTGVWGGVTLDGLRVSDEARFEAIPTPASDTAAILFTSGSTGPAKGVVYTHAIFDAQTRFIQTMYGIEGGEVDLACFPLFGLFSIALGMTVVIPELDPTKPAQADPARLVQAIRNQSCTSAFGSPSIWKNVARYCLSRGVRLPTLRRILMAGAPVPAELHAQFKDILPPGAEVHTPYGATESLPVSTIGSGEVLSETAAQTATGAGTCVGWPAPEMSIRIIRISDEPIARWHEAEVLPVGKIGEICVRGPVVTSMYEGEPEHTRAAKIVEVDAEGRNHIVHRMGDVGYLDEQGRLWFCGRKAHRVETAAGTLFPVPVEAIFDAHPDVFKTALVGVHGTPLIVAQMEVDAQKSPPAVAEELLALGSEHAHTRAITRVLFHSKLPVDVRHNAKIDRTGLARWAREKLP